MFRKLAYGIYRFNWDSIIDWNAGSTVTEGNKKLIEFVENKIELENNLIIKINKITKGVEGTKKTIELGAVTLQNQPKLVKLTYSPDEKGEIVPVNFEGKDIFYLIARVENDTINVYSQVIPGGVKTLFELHPIYLTTLLECLWELRENEKNYNLGDPAHRSDLDLLRLPKEIGLATVDLQTTIKSYINSLFLHNLRNFRWNHLIYAYMIENTRIYEIFERVVWEFLYGEQLGVPIIGSEYWLRSTEELFFKAPPHFAITAVASHIRPDLRATRRNAYYRMFGMDLNHGTDAKKEYPFVKAKTYNSEFISTLEEFLRQVWIGISNVNNVSGTNPTDDGAIYNLAERLHNMLISRRETGNLSREEFYAVSVMSWFHLTLESDSPIVMSLRAEASSPEERLFKIADRVKLPAHGLSRSYFEMAEPMSRVLTFIETGSIINSDAAKSFYDPAGGNPLPDDMKTIITHWSITTGRNMKTEKTQITA